MKTKKTTSKKNPAPRVPFREIVEILPKVSGNSGEILRRIAAFETRRLFLRAARRLRKNHGAKTEIRFATASAIKGDDPVPANESRAIETVLDGGTVYVTAVRGRETLGSRTVGKNAKGVDNG